MSFSVYRRLPRTVMPFRDEKIRAPFVSLKLAETADRATIYRQPWRAMASGALVAAATLLVAAVFIVIAVSQPASPVAQAFAIFGGVFALAGLALTYQIGIKSRTWLAEGMVPVAIATANDLTLIPAINARPIVLSWGDVAGITLADELKIVDSDGRETHRHQMIVYLASGASGSLFEQLLSGLTRSGEGRSCVVVDYPPDQSAALADALCRFATAGCVATKQSVLHDGKAGRDT
jgi:drug/metabolite transporter superfamily protein YnfA